VIGIHDSHLSVLNSYYEFDYFALARRHNVRSLVVTGKYKLWPRDLFEQEAVERVCRGGADDRLTNSDCIDQILTDEGVYSSDQFMAKYADILTASVDEFPGWKTKPDLYARFRSFDTPTKSMGQTPSHNGASDHVSSAEAAAPYDVFTYGWFEEHVKSELELNGDAVLLASELSEKYSVPVQQVREALVDMADTGKLTRHYCVLCSGPNRKLDWDVEVADPKDVPTIRTRCKTCGDEYTPSAENLIVYFSATREYKELISKRACV
jgi:hypothetical protein